MIDNRVKGITEESSKAEIDSDQIMRLSPDALDFAVSHRWRFWAFCSWIGMTLAFALLISSIFANRYVVINSPTHRYQVIISRGALVGTRSESAIGKWDISPVGRMHRPFKFRLPPFKCDITRSTIAVQIPAWSLTVAVPIVSLLSAFHLRQKVRKWEKLARLEKDAEDRSRK